MHRKIAKHLSIEKAKRRRKNLLSEDVNYSMDYIQRTFKTNLNESNRIESNRIEPNKILWANANFMEF